MAKKKKRRISKKKVIIALLIVLVIVGGVVTFILTQGKQEKTVKIKSVDTIEGYDYTLKSNATKYYKSLFKQLKTTLESDDIDEEKYADLVTKLFIADFYNLNNKINKNDIGGVQFVYKPFRKDFKKLAMTSMYKSVENNLYKNRKQSLPIVTNVSTQVQENTSFEYDDETDEEAYVINFEITYKKDLGYQTSGVVTLIHNGKKVEVAKLEE